VSRTWPACWRTCRRRSPRRRWVRGRLHAPIIIIIFRTHSSGLMRGAHEDVSFPPGEVHRPPAAARPRVPPPQLHHPQVDTAWALWGRSLASSGPSSFSLSLSLSRRDLKVSNLLMTDKGCVKIGESPPEPPGPSGTLNLQETPLSLALSLYSYKLFFCLV